MRVKDKKSGQEPQDQIIPSHSFDEQQDRQMNEAAKRLIKAIKTLNSKPKWPQIFQEASQSSGLTYLILQQLSKGQIEDIKGHFQTLYKKEPNNQNYGQYINKINFHRNEIQKKQDNLKTQEEDNWLFTCYQRFQKFFKWEIFIMGTLTTILLFLSNFIGNGDYVSKKIIATEKCKILTTNPSQFNDFYLSAIKSLCEFITLSQNQFWIWIPLLIVFAFITFRIIRYIWKKVKDCSNGPSELGEGKPINTQDPNKQSKKPQILDNNIPNENEQHMQREGEIPVDIIRIQVKPKGQNTLIFAEFQESAQRRSQ